MTKLKHIGMAALAATRQARDVWRPTWELKDATGERSVFVPESEVIPALCKLATQPGFLRDGRMRCGSESGWLSPRETVNRIVRGGVDVLGARFGLLAFTFLFLPAFLIELGGVLPSAAMFVSCILGLVTARLVLLDGGRSTLQVFGAHALAIAVLLFGQHGFIVSSLAAVLGPIIPIYVTVRVGGQLGTVYGRWAASRCYRGMQSISYERHVGSSPDIAAFWADHDSGDSTLGERSPAEPAARRAS